MYLGITYNDQQQRLLKELSAGILMFVRDRVRKDRRMQHAVTRLLALPVGQRHANLSAGVHQLLYQL